jgi:hypothetical protein
MNSKAFWILIVVGTILGGIVGVIMKYNKDSKLENATIKYCYEYRDYIKYPSIVAIEDLSEGANYISYLSNGTGISAFKFSAIFQGQKVYVLDSVSNFPLINIAILFSKASGGRSTYEEVWVWHKFLLMNKKETPVVSKAINDK